MANKVRSAFRSVTGENTIEALKKARELYGDSAILITTKQVQPQTINKKPLFEVIVSIDEPDDVQKPNPKVINYDNAQTKLDAPAKPKFSVEEVAQKPKKTDDDVSLSISNLAKELSEIANISQKDTQNELPKHNAKKIDEVAKQVNRLDEKLNLITDMFWDEKAISRNNLAIPPEFASIYKLARNSGMKNEHLDAIMQTTLMNMPTQMKANPTAVKRYFYSLLRNMLPCRKERESKKQRIIMLVGPTGVGKTTTLAKLAARFAYSSEKRYNTGIITLDTYRIGAVEQLFQYAKMMKLPILDVIEVDEFKNAIKRLNHCDVILIDTTGNSQYDKEKLDKLDKFLRASEASIDVNLVLSAGSKVDDLIEIYNGFSFLDIDTLIITKFDETKVFGNVFSLIYETNTPVSYFCVGQEVPDDLIEANSEFLVSCVLDGFKKDKQ